MAKTPRTKEEFEELLWQIGKSMEKPGTATLNEKTGIAEDHDEELGELFIQLEKVIKTKPEIALYVWINKKTGQIMYPSSKDSSLYKQLIVGKVEELKKQGFEPVCEIKKKAGFELVKEVTLKDIQSPTFFPIPTKVDRKLRPLFLHRIIEKDFQKEIKTESGDILEVFKKDQWSREVYYYALKGQLENLRYTKTPSLANLAYPCFISTVGFAIKQGTLSPYYTKTDKLKSLGYTGREGGKILKLIENMEKLLKFLTYDIIDKRKGRRYKESLGSLYSHLEIRHQGRNIIFNPSLDPKTLGEDLPKLINNQLRGISWVDYSKIIKDRDLSLRQRRLFGYLEGLKGQKTTKPKTARHLLLNIVGTTQTYFKERPRYCHKVLIDEGLEVAKAKPYLSLLDYRTDYKGYPLDVRKWAFRFIFASRQDKKQEILPKTLIDKIVEWNSREIFGTKLKQDKIKIMVENTIRTYGEEIVRTIFEKEIKTYSPHPKNFWAEIKKLKAKKLIRQLVKKE